jgi:hypothetical protein
MTPNPPLRTKVAWRTPDAQSASQPIPTEKDTATGYLIPVIDNLFSRQPTGTCPQRVTGITPTSLVIIKDSLRDRNSPNPHLYRVFLSQAPIGVECLDDHQPPTPHEPARAREDITSPSSEVVAGNEACHHVTQAATGRRKLNEKFERLHETKDLSATPAGKRDHARHFTPIFPEPSNPNRLRDGGLFRAYRSFRDLFLEHRTISPREHQTALFRGDTRPTAIRPIDPAIELPRETHPNERSFLFPTGGPILLGTLSAGDWPLRRSHRTT